MSRNGCAVLALAAVLVVFEPPAGFLRFEGALAQPDDPLVRVDLMP